MANSNILREITPLAHENCFIYISRIKKEFTYPIHYHPEYELNFIENGKGVKRIIGDSIEEIDDLELVLITGDSLEHAWFDGSCRSESVKEITIQFNDDLFRDNISKNQFRSIKIMLERARNGLLFSKETATKVKNMLVDLGEEKNGFYSYIKFMTLMYELSQENNVRILSSSTFASASNESDSRRIKKILAYLQANYKQPIRLADAAALVNMSEVAFTRFIKKRTSKTFVEFLNDVRLGVVSRMLVDTSRSVSEICYECGFNNLSNFNRIFKKKKGFTPKEFRENYAKKKIII